VGHDATGAQVCIVTPVRSPGVQNAAREHGVGQSRIDATVKNEVDLQGNQSAVSFESGLDTSPGWVALGRGPQILASIVDEFYRPPSGFPGEQGGMPGDHVGVL